MSDAAIEARSQAFKKYKKELPYKIDQEVQNLTTSSAKLAIESFKLVLLPLWMTEIPHNSQEYLALINGQTGQVIGEMPKKKNPGFLDWLGDLFDEN